MKRALTCRNRSGPDRSGRQDLNLRPLDPQIGASAVRARIDNPYVAAVSGWLCLLSCFVWFVRLPLVPHWSTVMPMACRSTVSDRCGSYVVTLDPAGDVTGST